MGEPVIVHTKYGSLYMRHITNLSKDACLGIVASRSLQPSSPTLVRIQSSCVLGEAFGSSECDCAAQIAMALERVTREDGVFVYVFEEGRGAGLERKLKAMRIQQDCSIDTDEAFRRLGMPADLRDYKFASGVITELLGPNPRIILMTNNPDKQIKLQENGIVVLAVESAVPPFISSEALPELVTKKLKFGHTIPAKIVSDKISKT